MTRLSLRGLTAVGLIFAATAAFAQQPQTVPNTDQPKMEHGQMGGTGQAQPQPGPGMGQKGMEMGKQGMGMGQQGQGMGEGGMMKDMHQMMRPSDSANPPAAAAPAPQTGQVPTPAPQCPAGTTVQMDASGQHVCK